MNDISQAVITPVWRGSFILSSGKNQAQIRDTQPTAENYGALDAKTFAAVEADALFDEINHAQTRVGQSVLYRSIARPVSDAALLQSKQEALRELESNPELLDALEKYIKRMALDETSLYHLLYGEFAGGFTTDDPRDKAGKERLEFGGYGYRQFIDGTGFVVDMVDQAEALPTPTSDYLRTLVQALRDFARTHTYSLMHGPIYVSEGKFLTRTEKSRLPVPRFRPSVFKWPFISLFLIFMAGLLFFFESTLSELGASYIGYGVLILLVPIIPIILQAVSASDRDSVIYPLQKLFRHSEDLARAIEALGMIDELLALRRHGHSIPGDSVLPEIHMNERHALVASAARNPLLVRARPDYVPNDITLDNDKRLLIVTGPNSGGKTAYCKTVVQIQLLAQAGAYVPAAQARVIPAEHIFYQVPDPGQLEESMGRFAHELKQTREIFFSSTSRSLVVLDELAEGTTFEEKMTLSEYVLKGFHQLGATTILVTHNHELCERLQQEQIGDYLQVEFDSDQPTHRLIPGVSRISHADRIASALGFSKEDVASHLASLQE
ncbi:DNA mismatch repair protein MutS [Nitrosomonas sp. HPC101]|uniref:MutS-related protein n=1 Tax=Nitrosomonas sp. HPC101 TaxID=1658667 RepID=UPI00136A4D6B|nr:DNA mismatch repair protein MutS [Nitrosomonas sp. HPC101]MXS85869.1 DNA mismatch repair protein MutS [Nitrosomonas sp. HPC101]